jgi:hypothetical protein
VNWSYAKAGFITLSVTTFNRLNKCKTIYELLAQLYRARHAESPVHN